MQKRRFIALICRVSRVEPSDTKKVRIANVFTLENRFENMFMTWHEMTDMLPWDEALHIFLFVKFFSFNS